MTLAEFVAEWSGKFVTAPGGLGRQCVDLANQYGQEVFGFPHEWKNAIDWYGFDTAHWAWVKNDAGNPNQIPEPGDVVVWGNDPAIGTGVNGHIDIFLDGTGYQFHGFDQNWPLNSPAHIQWHDYQGVIGWAKPIVATPVVIPPVIVPPVEPPEDEPAVVPEPFYIFSFEVTPDDFLRPIPGAMRLSDALIEARMYVAAHPGATVRIVTEVM